MHFIYDYEKKMWDAAKDGDKSAFAGLVSEAAVMICGEYRIFRYNRRFRNIGL